MNKTSRLSAEIPSILQSAAPAEFNFDNPEINRNALCSLLGDSQLAQIGDWNACPLWKAGDFIFLTDLNRTTLHYLVTWHTINCQSPLHKLASRVAVWVNTDAGEELFWDLPKHVFFDLLLKDHEAIISDERQTPDFRRFWAYRVRDALRLGHEVFFYDLVTGKSLPVCSGVDYNKICDEAYKDTPDYKARRFCLAFQVREQYV